MTVVLLAITTDHIVMVSDMRLTSDRAPDGVETETAAKTIFWQNSYLLGYTGWACSRPSNGTAGPMGNRTDFWIGSTLASQSGLAEGVTALQSVADDRVGGVLTRSKILEIIGAGWAHRDGIDGLVPYAFLVSNRHPDPAQDVYPRFRARAWRVQATPLLLSVGQRVDQKRVDRALRRHVKHSTGAEPIVFDLATEIRRVASSNPRVGSNLLIASLPRWTVPARAYASPDPPDWSSAQFRYATTNPTDATYRLPVVTGGGISVGGQIVEFGDEDHQPIYPRPNDEYECPP